MDRERRGRAERNCRCATVVFPFAGEVGTCVDCGKRWTRTDRAAAIRQAEQQQRRRRA
jgi:hypothetical protein